MTAYYNEIDPFAAAWLRELIADKLIAPGEVDERSIEDVTPNDLRSFRQCHFFAGIGIWSIAARLSGIDDDTPLWSGSCPCQPFSSAGKGSGFSDERHLWPAFHYLIEQCAPPIVVGEQVAGADGDAWLDLVSADLDATDFTFGAAETVAAGFGAPHIRSRNYWVALANSRFSEQLARAGAGTVSASGGRSYGRIAGSGSVGWLGDAGGATGERNAGTVPGAQEGKHGAGIAVDGSVDLGSEHASHSLRALADADAGRWGWLPNVEWSEHYRTAARWLEDHGRAEYGGALRGHGHNGGPGPTNGLWSGADWLFCRDQKWRAVESGTFPLADAGTVRNRVGLLRGAGNAINLAQAVGFLKAVVASIR